MSTFHDAEIVFNGRTYTISWDDDRTGNPDEITYSVHSAEGDQPWLGDVIRTFETTSSYHAGYTYYKRGATKAWYVDVSESDHTDDLEEPFKTEWIDAVQEGFDDLVASRQNEGRTSTWKTIVKQLLQAIEDAPDESHYEMHRTPPAPLHDINDTRLRFSPTPSVASFEADPAHRTECPHPDCLSRAENACHGNSINSRVVVDGGEDYCIHHSCTWTEDQGEHFAPSADVCPNCNRLTMEHGLHEARDCLQYLIHQGMPTEYDATKTVPYEVVE